MMIPKAKLLNWYDQYIIMRFCQGQGVFELEPHLAFGGFYFIS